MNIKLYCPSIKKVGEAKELGIDLLESLGYIAKCAIEETIEGNSKWISVDVDKEQSDQLKGYNIDAASHLVGAYVSEIKNQLVREYVENNKEIKLDVVDEKSIREILDNTDYNTVVTNAQIGSVLQEMTDFEITPLSDGSFVDPHIYFIGKYKNIEVKVDPYMIWDDNRMIFIKD